VAGVRSTLANLDRVGLGHTGTARSAAEAARTRIYRVRGARVAHLSSTYGTNGVRVPVPWAVDVTRVATVLADARRAREEGADLVVVSLHWGTEYRTSPDAGQRRLARVLLASPDVDLILGAHAHVQQPVERIGGKHVVYGMGNILSNQSPARGLRPETQDSSVVTAHVVRRGDRYAVDRVTYTPTFCDVRTHVVHPVLAALADPRTSADLRARLRASLARTTAIQNAPAPGVRGAVLAGPEVPD
jgi:poly-gamma-glutamate synthesis protein (capsule biosynthesis protein)